MSATTIKLDAGLVKKVTSLKPKDASISGYVRGLIEREHQVRELQAASRTYAQYLRENPEERRAMEVWESAPLSNKVEPRQP
jgi:hypothetical protein